MSIRVLPFIISWTNSHFIDQELKLINQVAVVLKLPDWSDFEVATVAFYLLTPSPPPTNRMRLINTFENAKLDLWISHECVMERLDLPLLLSNIFTVNILCNASLIKITRWIIHLWMIYAHVSILPVRIRRSTLIPKLT